MSDAIRPRHTRRVFLRTASLTILGAAVLPLAAACQSPQPAAPKPPADASKPAAGAASGAASGAAKPAASPTAAAGAGGQATGPAAAAAVGGGAKVLNIWSGYPEMKPYYERVAKAFTEQNKDVKVEILTHPLREFEQKLSATIPANSVAEIIEISVYANQKFIEAGLIPKNPQEMTDFARANYPEFNLKLMTDKDGGIYGLPLFWGSSGIFYNKKMYAEAGISAPPKTMDEMEQMAIKLAKRDGNNLTRAGFSFRKSGGGSGIAEKWWIMAYPHGATILEKAPSGKFHAGYNNEGGVRTLQRYIDGIHKHKYDSMNLKADAEGFQLEQHAMFQRETWVIGDTAKKNPNLDYDAFQIPTDKRSGLLVGASNLYITKTAKDPKLAWEFIQESQKQEHLLAMLDEIGWVPLRQKGFDPASVVAKKPQFKAFVSYPDSFEKFNYEPIAEFDEIMTKLAERLSTAYLDASLVDNKAGMQKVLDDAAKETNDILKHANRYE
ncbi:MAG: extracellular solute-binding protein [Chloroflexi bacterium]|nr:extracellular solute-binding protein [Chloroflexota bacterium]